MFNDLLINANDFKNSLNGLTNAQKEQKITDYLRYLYDQSKNAVDVDKAVNTIKEDIERRNTINEIIKEVSMIERPNEKFTDLYGNEDIAEVSNFSRVRFKVDYLNYKAGDILKPCLNNDYYLNFVINGKHYFNHQAVLLSFIGEPEGNLQADHIDRCRLNNDLKNLHYVTKSENAKNKETQKEKKSKKENKVLVQYSLDFQPKAIYRSVKDAIFVNGWGNSKTGIYRAVNFGTPTKNSYWRWKNLMVY